MQNYIGVKLIQAEEAMKDGGAGYNVLYPDGYASWSPKEQFERAYLCLATQGDKPFGIDVKDIDCMIANVQVAEDTETLSTAVKAELIIGSEIIEIIDAQQAEHCCLTSAAEVVGAAMIGVEAKVRFALEFVLQWGQFGLKKVNKNVEA